MKAYHDMPRLQVKLGIALCLAVFAGATSLLEGCWKSERMGAERSSSSIKALPPDVIGQTDDEVALKNMGCVSCHTQSDAPTMHNSPAVRLACVDCHGGQGDVTLGNDVAAGSARYEDVKRKAHVQPRYPEAWSYKDGKLSSANPQQSYTLLNREDTQLRSFHKSR